MSNLKLDVTEAPILFLQLPEREGAHEGVRTQPNALRLSLFVTAYVARDKQVRLPLAEPRDVASRCQQGAKRPYEQLNLTWTLSGIMRRCCRPELKCILVLAQKFKGVSK